MVRLDYIWYFKISDIISFIHSFIHSLSQVKTRPTWPTWPVQPDQHDQFHMTNMTSSTWPTNLTNLTSRSGWYKIRKKWPGWNLTNLTGCYGPVIANFEPLPLDSIFPSNSTFSTWVMAIVIFVPLVPPMAQVAETQIFTWKLFQACFNY